MQQQQSFMFSQCIFQTVRWNPRFGSLSYRRNFWLCNENSWFCETYLEVIKKWVDICFVCLPSKLSRFMWKSWLHLHHEDCSPEPIKIKVRGTMLYPVLFCLFVLSWDHQGFSTFHAMPCHVSAFYHLTYKLISWSLLSSFFMKLCLPKMHAHNLFDS